MSPDHLKWSTPCALCSRMVQGEHSRYVRFDLLGGKCTSGPMHGKCADEFREKLRRSLTVDEPKEEGDQ